MRVTGITLAVFTFFNSLRFLAYFPQIVRAIRDQSGAEAISFGARALFLTPHSRHRRGRTGAVAGPAPSHLMREF